MIANNFIVFAAFVSYSIVSLFILLDSPINLYQITIENANIFPKQFFIRSHLVHFFLKFSAL